MAQIGNVEEIIVVKEHLERMKQDGLITEWELPYENLLTRRSAAIFFLSPVSEEVLTEIWSQLGRYDNFRQRDNTEKKLSELAYRVEFNQAE
ncbi:hypothetical protein acsn021_37580 [Anaerocolumna cellulosilytica]|uniref:Uncharacterized protein n=1 Tax=Anaerocolumna cellulosilytica TaxID=433286 RepID=A0A6S6R4C0_9FIRM|nr:hypothetical protein [Anaerocolumna cellulosilytica]MBB5194975.1 hypothetical protein [Anaerocolumna cellulosilytica]BCJ96189.1 hypothetical protein acsn021_37580 [Anaerocolumna cellulosilytica]